MTLEKREIPGTGSSEADTSGPAAVLNLYLPQAPTAEQADTLQYFRGEREPAPDDPSLAETQADSLAFAGQINGLQTEITLLNFAGLTAQADTLTARISYTIKGVQTTQDLTLTETGPETRLFRLRFPDPSPGTLKANIYLPVSPTPEAADVLQYYYGLRSPLPDDPILAESPDAPAGLIFRGTFQGVNTTVAIDPATFPSPTGNVDSFQATATLALDETAVMTLSATFSETAAQSCIFSAAYQGDTGGMPGQPNALARWVPSEVRNPNCVNTLYRPLCMRVRGLPSGLSDKALDGYRMTVNGAAFRVDPEGGPYYLKGLSRWLITVEPEGEPYTARVWDDFNNDLRMDPGEMYGVNCEDYQLQGDIRRNGVTLACGKVEVFLVDLDVDTDRSGGCDQWKDELGEDTFTRERGAVVLVNSNSDRTDSEAMDMQDTVINDGGDVNDTAQLVLRTPGDVIRRLGLRAALRIPASAGTHLRVFKSRNAGGEELLFSSAGTGWMEAVVPMIYLTKRGDHVMAVEALHYMGDPAAPSFDGSLTIELVYQRPNPAQATGWEDVPGFSDKVHLQVAPLVLAWNGQQAEVIYANHHIENKIRTKTTIPVLEQGTGGWFGTTRLWLQDYAELTNTTGSANQRIPTILDLGRKEGDGTEVVTWPQDLRKLESCYGYVSSGAAGVGGGNGGDIEVTPPLVGYPLGRVVRGDRFGTDSAVRAFLSAQKVQVGPSFNPILLVGTSWLDTAKHVDEVLCFVPKDKGAAALVPSPRVAVDIMHLEFLAGKGNTKLRVGCSGGEGGAGATKTETITNLLVKDNGAEWTTLTQPLDDTNEESTLALAAPRFAGQYSEGRDRRLVLRLGNEYCVVESGGGTTQVKVDRKTINDALGITRTTHRVHSRVYAVTSLIKTNFSEEYEPDWPGPQRRLDRIRESLGTLKLREGVLEIIELPVLFMRKSQALYCAYTSNVVNCLVAGGKAIMPMTRADPDDTKLDPFETYITAKLQARTAVKAEFVDAWELHTRLGEVHCGSNTKRAPAASLWWVAWPGQ
ncbi:MAG TPA: protein-arginine deiminase family protein [Planctomycetota bacterium]|nr:protein-arginine deiminase family protein [Planctomycetota bacterium]